MGWGTATGLGRKQPGAVLPQAHTCPGGGLRVGPARALPAPTPRRATPPPPGGAHWLQRRLGARPARPAGGAAGQSALRRHRCRRHRRRHRHCRREHRAPRAPRTACSRPARPPPAPRPRRGAPAWPRAAATTPRAVLRVKNGAAKLPKPPAAAAAAEAPGAGAGMERSQSRLSLSASFEALAIYFPCMNSFDDEDAGKCASCPRPPGAVLGARSRGPLPDPVLPQRWPLFSPPPTLLGDAPQGLLSHLRDPRVSRKRCLLASRTPHPPGPVDPLHLPLSRRWALRVSRTQPFSLTGAYWMPPSCP